MTHTFTCIVCPNGCRIEAESRGRDLQSIRGAACPKGEAYVRQELADPRRNIATSVALDGGALPLVSVRLSRPIPKDMIFPVMEAVKALRVRAPVHIGQVVLANVCSLGADVIATKNVDRL